MSKYGSLMEFALFGKEDEVLDMETMSSKKKPDLHKDIETQERKSSELWRKTDSPTSPTERKENMWKRVTNRVKTDKEG